MAPLMLVQRAWKHLLLPVMALSIVMLLSACGGNTVATNSSTALAAGGLGLPANRGITGFHTLVWQEPATRQDGTSLAPNEIGAYRIYYKRTDARSYKVITLTDPGATSLMLSGFSSGQYDFRITAVDTNGLESAPSRTVVVSI